MFAKFDGNSGMGLGTVPLFCSIVNSSWFETSDVYLDFILLSFMCVSVLSYLSIVISWC